MMHRFSLSLALVLFCATMAGVLCLGGVGRTLRANLAYVDLVHGLLGLPESRGGWAERFEAWAAARGSSDMAGPAAVYGRAMLAKADAIPGDSSIVAYLDALETSESRREMLILALLGEARTPGDVRIAAQLLGEPRASQWLANTAVLRWRAGDRDWPQVLLQVLCESGDPAGLPADEVRRGGLVRPQRGPGGRHTLVRSGPIAGSQSPGGVTVEGERAGCSRRHGGPARVHPAGARKLSPVGRRLAFLGLLPGEQRAVGRGRGRD